MISWRYILAAAGSFLQVRHPQDFKDQAASFAVPASTAKRGCRTLPFEPFEIQINNSSLPALQKELLSNRKTGLKAGPFMPKKAHSLSPTWSREGSGSGSSDGAGAPDFSLFLDRPCPPCLSPCALFYPRMRSSAIEIPCARCLPISTSVVALGVHAARSRASRGSIKGEFIRTPHELDPHLHVMEINLCTLRAPFVHHNATSI